jgi:hypothetical protein
MLPHPTEIHPMDQKPVIVSVRGVLFASKHRAAFAHIIAVAVVVLAACAGPVFAGVQVITNPSFETNTLADGASTTGTIFAWSGTGVFGAINPTTTQYAGAGGNVLPGPGTDGANVAYINGNGTIFQSLTLTLGPSTAYTLTGAVGDPSASTYGSAFAQLIAGSTVLANLNIPDPGAGNFATWTLSYSSSASQPELGQTLEIILGNSASAAGSVVNFDNLSLTTLPAPEPTTLALGLLALSGLAGYRFVSQRKANAG